MSTWEEQVSLEASGLLQLKAIIKVQSQTQEVCGESAFVTSTQEMLMLLVYGLYSE